ncbi:MAG: macro domain-containing protein [Candidatus Heimdallarchaeota archaeon]|nr:macro domain-containing protein [Candidatus Heimdallarchaeota archaeon]MBY8994277.1 macro domain-containing protein [Candidatus Heimdallarchaeota archaeon]
MIVSIIKGDISEVKADALVNAANNELWMGLGVAGALKRKGGKEIETEAMSKGPIKPGEAIETSAGKLDAKYVIHAAGMRSDGYITEDYLRNSVLNSLLLAEKLKLESIAFPAIGTGVAGFSEEECARIMAEIVASFKPKYLQEVKIVLFSEDTYKKFLIIFGDERIEV